MSLVQLPIAFFGSRLVPLINYAIGRSTLKADGVLIRWLRSKVTAEVKAIVAAQMRQDDETTAFQLHKLLVEKGYNISRRTILRCRHDLGWTFRGSSYCQLICHVNKVKRLEWANSTKMTTLTTWCGLMNAQSSWSPTVDLLAKKEKSHQRANQGLYWFLYIHVMLIAEWVIVGLKWSSIKACILLVHRWLISVAVLFSDNYDENKHIKPIQATNLLFCAWDSKATLWRTLCILIQLPGESWVEQPVIKTCFDSHVFAWQQAFGKCAKISLRVKSTFPITLAVFPLDKSTLFPLCCPTIDCLILN